MTGITITTDASGRRFAMTLGRTVRLCEEPGCDLKHLAKGRCRHHYHLYRRFPGGPGEHAAFQAAVDEALAAQGRKRSTSARERERDREWQDFVERGGPVPTFIAAGQSPADALAAEAARRRRTAEAAEVQRTWTDTREDQR